MGSLFTSVMVCMHAAVSVCVCDKGLVPQICRGLHTNKLTCINSCSFCNTFGETYTRTLIASTLATSSVQDTPYFPTGAGESGKSTFVKQMKYVSLLLSLSLSQHAFSCTRSSHPH